VERVRVGSRGFKRAGSGREIPMLIFAIYQSVATLVIKRTKDAFSLAVSVFQDF